MTSLQRLALGREMDAEKVFDWLAAAVVPTLITRLSVRCGSERDVDLFGPFLKLAGATVRELDLDWSLPGDKSMWL